MNKRNSETQFTNIVEKFKFRGGSPKRDSKSETKEA